MARRNGTRNRMGNEQIETLICYMEQHSLFARGQICKLGAQGNVKYRKMWNELSILLNRIGPAQKDVASWQKSWTKLRLTAKSNKAKFIKSISKTGHNAPDSQLSDNDQRISQIYGKYGTGMNLGKELGFHHAQYKNFQVNDDFQYSSFLMINTNRLGTELQRCSNVTPSRINDGFEELCDYIFHLYENDVAKRKVIHQKKPTDAQIKCLIDFMERHPNLANGTTENDCELWAVLVTLLNSTKGVFKTEKAWKKTWAGLVTAARQSMRFLIDGRKETAMSNNHIKIIDIVGYKEDHVYSSNKSYFLNSHQPSPSTSYDRPSSSNSSSYQPASSSSSSCKGLTTMNWYDRPSTSTSNIYSTKRSSPVTSLLSEEPRTKMRRLGNPPMLGFASEQEQRPSGPAEVAEPTRPAGSSAASTGAVDRSKLVQALEQKGSELVTTLAQHLTSCFEKQNDAILKGLKSLSNSLVQTLPKIIAEEFNNTLKNGNEQADSTHMASGTVEFLLTENNDDDSSDEVFQLIQESVAAAKADADTCAICQDTMLNPKKMERCEHKFCNDCINMWLRHSSCCPICRKSTQEDVPNFNWEELELDSD